MHLVPSRWRFITTLGLILLVSTLPVRGQDTGQSAGDLRLENERLQTRTRDLEADLAAAAARIAELEAEIASLRAELAARATPPVDVPTPDVAVPAPVDDRPVTIDESRPGASPRALRRAVQAAYDADIAAIDVPTEDRALRGYLRGLEIWTGGINRRFRDRVEWRIRILEDRPGPRGRVLRVEALDPRSGAILGAPFELIPGRSLERRLDDLNPAGSDRNLIVDALLECRVLVNPARRESGEGPAEARLLGPFLEFGFALEPRQFRLEDPPPAPVPAPDPGSGSGSVSGPGTRSGV